MGLNTFLLSGFSFKDSEYELRLQHALFNTMLYAVMLMLSILSFIRLLEENYSQAIIDIILVILSISSIFYIRKSKINIYKVTPILLVFFFILVSFSFKNVGMSLVGSSWYIVLLIPAFFLTGIRIGMLLAFASVLSISILSLTGDNVYTTFEYIYVLIPLLLSILLIYLYSR